MRKNGWMKGVVPSAKKAWHNRLLELGCDPREFCYSEKSTDGEAFFSGRKVHVLIDARPGKIGPVMTFWPAHADVRGLLKCLAILE